MNMNKAAFTYNLERGMFGELQPYPWMWATDLSGAGITGNEPSSPMHPGANSERSRCCQ